MSTFDRIIVLQVISRRVFPLDVAVYTRVSTKHEEQYTSLENQQKFYLEYCEKNSYNLIKMYTDEGLSATSPKRKGFLEMIYDAGLDYEKDKDTNEILYFKDSDREPKFELIITKDVSRFSRNIDSMTLVKKLKNKGVCILFENAGFSTSGNDTDWQMRLSLLLTFSQQESLDRAKKVSFSYTHNSKSGKFHLAKDLYGYHYDKDTKEVVVIPEQAEIVKKVFNLYVNDGYGNRSISKYLNENNVKTQNNMNWTPTNIRRLIRNEKYIGRVILNRYTNNGITSGKKRIERPENEWVILEGINPETNKYYITPIIDIEIWNKVQEIINKRAEGSLKQSNKVKNIFYNKLFCGCCGSAFVRISTTKQRKEGLVKKYTYMCTGRRRRDDCSNKGISHDVLVRKITEFAKNELSKRLNDKKEMFEKIINVQKLLLKIRLKTSESTIKSSKDRIVEIDKEVDKLVTAFARSNSTVISVIEKKIETLEQEKLELNQKILESDSITIENQMNNFDELLSDMQSAIKDEYTFEEALKFIGKITSTNDKLEFQVVANEKLEPLLNIDVNRFNHSNLDSLISQLSEELEEFKTISATIKK